MPPTAKSAIGRRVKSILLIQRKNSAHTRRRRPRCHWAPRDFWDDAAEKIILHWTKKKIRQRVAIIIMFVKMCVRANERHRKFEQFKLCWWISRAAWTTNDSKSADVGWIEFDVGVFFRSVSVLVSSCHMRNLQSLWTMHSICAVIVLANHVCDGNKLNAGRVVA